MKVALLTGGGDCPGMNAFVRAVTRSVLHFNPDAEVWGILDGWIGFLNRSYRQLQPLDTAGISRLGGTILGTVRLPRLRTDVDLQKEIARNFVESEFDALIACGGNGSLRAAEALDRHVHALREDRPVLFTSASIDNDVANVYGTAIGFYSAIERSMTMMEWIRDTASAHRRVYIVGSMGRSSAYLPFYAGLATGAEYVIRPGEEVDFEAVADMIAARDRDTRIIVSESYEQSLEQIRSLLTDALQRRNSKHEIRAVDMGYFQRGGVASVTDVLRADWIGYSMARALTEGHGSGFFGAFSIGGPPNVVSLDVAARPDSTHEDIPTEIINMGMALR